VAQQAAQLLKTDFGAARVVVFGSVCSPQLFHQHSDVDLAVWDLEEHFYYQAVGRLQGLDPDIAVDVVEVERAPRALQEVIQQTGVPL
jgi:predicted nucleotidyltransferase